MNMKKKRLSNQHLSNKNLLNKSGKINKKIIIVGAGPGGLTSGMILAHRGFDVTIYEKEKTVGGRNGVILKNGFKFDIGPTFLMMKFILDEVFEESGHSVNNYLKFQKLNPMYRLQFKDFSIDVTNNKTEMKKQIAKYFPNEEKGYDKFMKKESIRYKKFYPCLQKDYSSIFEYFKPTFVKAIPYIITTKSMYQLLGDYFNSENLRFCFTFQSKYLGMSAKDCPGQFIIIPYIEHAFGVYHVKGGLSEISQAMSSVVNSNGGVIKLNSPVKKVLLENKKIIGVELENGRRDYSDEVIINSDFAYSMSELVDNSKLKKWNSKNLKNKQFSCSTFMIYLGLDKIYDMPHHTIIFADDYNSNIDDIFKNKILSKDTSIYIRNASINDETIAPKGKSAVYILVPVSNTSGKINWNKEKLNFRKIVLDTIKRKTNMIDIEQHIEFEQIITPFDWEKSNIYYGATFNLAHSLNQMLYLRPHNRFEELDNCYIVGGGTHPGSGLPTIYESGRIAANLISKKYGLKFYTKNLEV